MLMGILYLFLSGSLCMVHFSLLVLRLLDECDLHMFDVISSFGELWSYLNLPFHCRCSFNGLYV
jgi:hypothetical protein